MCTVTNNTYNGKAEMDKETQFNTTPAASPVLLPQVQYTCSIKALLSDGGFGLSSNAVDIWTKPACKFVY